MLPSGTVDMTIKLTGQEVTLPGALRFLTSTVSASSSSVAPGESLTISFTSEGWEWSWDDWDWIGVFKPGAKNESSAAVWYTSIEAANGSFTLTAPAEPGQYEIRVLQNSTVQASTTVIVR